MRTLSIREFSPLLRNHKDDDRTGVGCSVTAVSVEPAQMAKQPPKNARAAERKTARLSDVIDADDCYLISAHLLPHRSAGDFHSPAIPILATNLQKTAHHANEGLNFLELTS